MSAENILNNPDYYLLPVLQRLPVVIFTIFRVSGLLPVVKNAVYRVSELLPVVILPVFRVLQVIPVVNILLKQLNINHLVIYYCLFTCFC